MRSLKYFPYRSLPPFLRNIEQRREEKLFSECVFFAVCLRIFTLLKCSYPTYLQYFIISSPPAPRSVYSRQCTFLSHSDTRARGGENGANKQHSFLILSSIFNKKAKSFSYFTFRSPPRASHHYCFEEIVCRKVVAPLLNDMREKITNKHDVDMAEERKVSSASEKQHCIRFRLICKQ